MKFLVDAQLPKRLCELLKAKGFDAIHTLDLPRGNSTTDLELINIADQYDRVVISKDNDFLDSYLLNGSPKKLLLVTTGNINNNLLIGLFERNIGQISHLMTLYSVVEFNNSELLVHY